MSKSTLFLFTVSVIIQASFLAFPILAGEAPSPASPALPSSRPLTMVAAQLDFTPAFTIYMPLISRAKPTNSMAQVVLQPDEVPLGFRLSNAGVITDFIQLQHLLPVEGYQAIYFNFSQLFSGPSFIINFAIRFQNPQGAQGYIQFIHQNLLNQPDETVVELPIAALGEETIAYQTIRTPADEIASVINIVMIRKGNIIAVVNTGGFFPVAADPALIMSLAGIISSKF